MNKSKMGLQKDEEVNYGTESMFMDDRYIPPPPKVYKLSSNIPENSNLTASFQNLLNKRINDNYKVRKRLTDLQECFTILKFTIIFIIFITTCKIITLFFTIQTRINQFDKSSQETIEICFYLIFTFALIIQFIESYAIVFDKFCLTIIFTSLEFMIIIWAILDNYHSKDEHWLIFLWLIGLVILTAHLMILYRMKCRKKNSKSNRIQSNQDSIKDKELSSESDQIYVQQQDCSYSDFLTQKQYDDQIRGYNVQHNQSNYGQSTINMPTITTISQVISNQEEDDECLNVNQVVKFVDDEEEAHEKREKLCKELIRQCKFKINLLELNQCNNQLILDQQKEIEQNELTNHNDDIESNQTSEFNSPKLSSSSCSDEMTCKEASKAILNGI